MCVRECGSALKTLNVDIELENHIQESLEEESNNIYCAFLVLCVLFFSTAPNENEVTLRFYRNVSSPSARKVMKDVQSRAAVPFTPPRASKVRRVAVGKESSNETYYIVWINNDNNKNDKNVIEMSPATYQKVRPCNTHIFCPCV